MATTITNNYGVPIGAVNLTQTEQIALGVAAAAKELAPDVVRIRYELKEDWSGQASVFFRVMITDAAARPPGLYRVTARARKELLAHVRPDGLALQWYFNFRSVSEQRRLREESWD